MARKLDPQLEFLLEGGAEVLESTGRPEASFERFGLNVEGLDEGERDVIATAPAEVDVLVRYAGDPEVLEEAGLRIRTIAGDVLTGSIALADVPRLVDIAEVEQVEAARAMHPELDLSISECRANQVHVGPPGRRGAGVIVGICDSGCDFTHPSFRRSDGTSRILFYWAQGLTPGTGEASPAPFGYGVEYSNAQINAALALSNPFSRVRHRDPGGHGTHVTGIAAGDGSVAGNGKPANTFVGVAPEADIIIVANASNGAEGLGTSTRTLDAVNYMFQKAGALSKACVVNMSLGDNLGPHDGTSLLERGLDNLLGPNGRAFVKSAGNVGSAQAHAQGNIATGGTSDVRFNQPGGDNSPNQIDIWYEGGDTFRASVIDPAGNATGVVNVGTAQTFTLPGGNTVRIDHRNNDPFNGDRRIFLTFGPGAMGQMRAGNWTIRLRSVTSGTGGRFDAWIQRGNVVPGFLAPHESNARTISTPGTAKEVITAANYITRGAGVGSLASSSSRGPTRDGRAAPTIAAPGSSIISANGENVGGDPYQPMGGTSMAAPHVTGAIALMFQKNKSRTQDQIKQCLTSTARSDAQTGPVPNTAWGAGKMNVKAAVDCVPTIGTTNSVLVVCPTRSVPRTTCPVQSATCPSFVTVCPSVAITCQQSVLTACVSVPRTTCPVQSATAACPSLAACPSAIDACPSALVNCGAQSLACNPQSIACGPGGGVLTPGGGVLTPGGLNPARPGGGIAGGLLRAGGRLTGGQEGSPADLPDGWDRGEEEGSEQPKPPLPEKGFYDYDEGWFDEDGQ